MQYKLFSAILYHLKPHIIPHGVFMDIVSINDLFSANNYWYWCTIIGIFSIPLLLKIYEKINLIFFMPKEIFNLVMTRTPVQEHRYSFFGKQRAYYTVEFELNKEAKSILKREFDIDNTQKFKLPISELDFQILKRIGAQQETGISATFGRGRFGALYFIKTNNKVSEEQIAINAEIRQQNKHSSNSHIKLNSKNGKSLTPITQFELQQKYMKKIDGVNRVFYPANDE